MKTLTDSMELALDVLRVVGWISLCLIVMVIGFAAPLTVNTYVLTAIPGIPRIVPAAQFATTIFGSFFAMCYLLQRYDFKSSHPVVQLLPIAALLWLFTLTTTLPIYLWYNWGRLA